MMCIYIYILIYGAGTINWSKKLLLSVFLFLFLFFLSEEEHELGNVTGGCANKLHLRELQCADPFYVFISCFFFNRKDCDCSFSNMNICFFLLVFCGTKYNQIFWGFGLLVKQNKHLNNKFGLWAYLADKTVNWKPPD